jgi:hypothetical protein
MAEVRERVEMNAQTSVSGLKKVIGTKCQVIEAK